MSDPVAPKANAAGAGLTMTAVAPPTHSDTFRELLSELNPLQYVPIVGTIYRAATGDTIPEGIRELGSLLVSGLTGGPIGLATNVACLAIEKATGIDPEAIGEGLLHDIGIGHATTAAPTPAASSQAAPAAVPEPPPLIGPGAAMAGTAGATPGPAAAATAPASAGAKPGPAAAAAAGEAGHAKPAIAWSTSQLTAYGVTRTAKGELKRGNVTGADVLNDLELARHHADTAPPSA